MATLKLAPATALLMLTLAMPAQAGNDFNSSRSNRERGTMAVAPGASNEAQDFNTTRSNKDKVATKQVHGDPHVAQASGGASLAAQSTEAQKGKTGHVTVLK